MRRHSVCDHGLYDGPRCRKRTTTVIRHLVPFGHRISMRGKDEPIFMARLAFRCDKHAVVEREDARISFTEYEAKMAANADVVIP